MKRRLDWTERLLISALGLTIALVVTGCGGNRTPATVAGNVAHNADIVVTAVDQVQHFVAAEETAGHIPTAQARVAMTAIGRALTSAKKLPPMLSKLNQLPSGSAESKPLVQQIQDALALVSSDVGQALVPIGDEATRKQIAALAAEVNKAIATVNGLILSGLH